MNFIEKIIDKILTWKRGKIDWDKVDDSFLIFSDLPHIKGWIKEKDTVIIAAHCDPTPGIEIYAMGFEKRTRKIVSVEKIPGTDIAICKIDKPFGDDIRFYKVADKIKKYDQIISFHQDRTFSTRRIKFLKDSQLRGCYADRRIIPGDSGLPWLAFNGKKFVVISHNHRGEYGVGPDYTKLLK